MAATAKLRQRATSHVEQRRSRLRTYLELARPANLLTAAADILAGSAAAGAWTSSLAWLVPASMCLYASGVVFNDVFDRELDGLERPERAIPSGRASAGSATLYGSILLMIGIGLSFSASRISGIVAVAIAVSALAYNGISKHNGLVGPLNMGLCRGLNLLLGMSAAGMIPAGRSMLMVFPIAYIAAITALSSGEVHGGKRSTAAAALVAVAAVLIGVPLLASSSSGVAVLWALPFMALLAWRVLPPLWRACQSSEPNFIFSAVKAGVLSLIVLDAAIAAAYAGPIYGLIVLSLMPVAGFLARRFAVT